MNRSKRPMPLKLRKKMGKEIRLAQALPTTIEMREYSDQLTAKELLKKYPKKNAQKKSELLSASMQKLAIKKKKNQKNISKRTNTGQIDIKSAPAHIHPEGTRWIKNLNKQAAAQRTVLAHKGKRKK